MLILAIAAALALTPVEAADIRCVAVVGIAARADAGLKAPGAEFAARIGADIIDRTQATREAVGNAILAEGLKVAAAPADPAERQRCIARMAEVLVR